MYTRNDVECVNKLMIRSRTGSAYLKRKAKLRTMNRDTSQYSLKVHVAGGTRSCYYKIRLKRYRIVEVFGFVRRRCSELALRTNELELLTNAEVDHYVFTSTRNGEC